MRPPKLRSTPLVQSLALMQQSTEANMKFAGLPRGTLRGTICDVDDPESRGRVCVVFDDMNPDIPQVSGAGEWSKERVGEEPDKSHWIDVSPAFKGKQPKGLIGKRVNISASNGQYQYAVLQDVLYDPQLLAEGKQKNLDMPNNSSMTRLPIYETGSLPPAAKENHGCMVVEMGGPMESDWLCVCLQRQGEYYWVRHIDMAHGHAGENDGKQEGVDTGGDAEQPVNQQTVWDYVFPTTGGEMQKYSKYGTSPRANPFGGEAKWYDPPK
jgi:hypothetical protein